MTNRDYPAVVLPLTEEDGGGFLAVAPDLPGCMGDGETAEAAVTDLRQAIEEWKDEAIRLGREVPKPGDYVLAMLRVFEAHGVRPLFDGDRPAGIAIVSPGREDTTPKLSGTNRETAGHE